MNVKKRNALSVVNGDCNSSNAFFDYNCLKECRLVFPHLYELAVVICVY
jgi:hypothetical protein